jgi:hypothetical protein
MYCVKRWLSTSSIPGYGWSDGGGASTSCAARRHLRLCHSRIIARYLKILGTIIKSRCTVGRINGSGVAFEL